MKWTERLSLAINTDPEIRPYLKYIPFDERYTGISITFLNKKGDHFARDCLYLASVHRGRVHYMQDRGDDEPLKEIYKETYEEALRIVKEQAPQVLPARDWVALTADVEKKAS